MGDGVSKGAHGGSAPEQVTETRLSQLEEEVRWLRLAVEKEKSEKEWLMGRYDEDARLKNEELARLRAQLDASAALSSARSTPSPARRKPAEIATLNPSDGDEEADTPTSQQPGVASTGMIGLRARRNLTLGVSTDRSASDAVSVAAVTPVDAVVAAVAPVALVAQAPKLDVGPAGAPPGALPRRLGDFARPASCTNAAATLLGGPARTLTLRPALADGMLEPMTDCRHNVRTWGATGAMDARSLWRRRQNELAEKASQIEAGETPLVETPKLYKLDRTVPDSPKRLPPASARRPRRETWCVPTTIAEDEAVVPPFVAEPERLPTEPLESPDEEQEPGSKQAGLAAPKGSPDRKKKRAARDPNRFISSHV